MSLETSEGMDELILEPAILSAVNVDSLPMVVGISVTEPP